MSSRAEYEIGLEAARKALGLIADRATDKRCRFVLKRSGAPVAAIVGLRDLRALRELRKLRKAAGGP